MYVLKKFIWHNFHKFKIYTLCVCTNILHMWIYIYTHTHTHTYIYIAQVVLVVKNQLTNAGDVRDVGSIPGLRRFLEKDMATHSSILAWRIPWTEEPGRLWSTGLQSWTWLKRQHTCICTYINTTVVKI